MIQVSSFHEYIEQCRVAERYVRGRLVDTERDWFERHLNHCEQCRDEIALARLFASHASAAAESPTRIHARGNSIIKVPEVLRPYQKWIILAASAVILLLVPFYGCRIRRR